jgi:hypothetical protein
MKEQEGKSKAGFRAKKVPITLRPGDIYAGKIQDGRYGAVRILKSFSDSVWLYITEYLDENPPSLDNPALLRCLIESRFDRKPQKAITCVDKKPTPEFHLVGNIPLTEPEMSIENNTYSGHWHISLLRILYFEWQWKHDRKTLLADLEILRQQDEARRQRELRSQKPKKMLDESTFWNIISLLSWKNSGADDLVLLPAKTALSKLGKRSIQAFEERLSFLLYNLDTQRHAENIGQNSYTGSEANFSVDSFLYSRCAVVSNGYSCYQSVMTDPSKMLKDIEFEPLLGLASAAHVLRYGEEMEYETGMNYETYSNVQGWNK